MTIHINKRRVGVGALLIVVLACVALGSFFYGQSTRKSDNQVDKIVNSHVQQAVQKRSEQAAAEEKAAVKDGRARMKRYVTAQWKTKMKKAVADAKDEAYDQGSAAGYSSGKTEGYSTGKEEGVEEGIDKASDDLTCSDDPDADLPPCFDW